MLENDRNALPRLLAYGGVAFFAAVIAYFLWAKWPGLAATRPLPMPSPPPAVTSEPPGGNSALPTASVRMKIKRIERRKYRREGEAPPPAVQR